MVLLEPVGDVRLAIAALGDIGVIGSGRARARAEGWDSPFAAARPPLSAADLAFANLEFPVGREEWVRGGRSREFRHDEELVGALARAGVRMVSLANNHAMDCGPRGLERTLEVCAAHGIATAGAGHDLEAARTPARLVVAGQRVVMLAYGATGGDDRASERHAGIAPLEPAIVLEDVARWRPEADILIVSPHWGSMYVDYPPPRVFEMAEEIEAAGADVILGHHPHVIQGVRRRGRCITFFSLGEGPFNCHAGDFHARVAAETRLLSGVFTIRVAASSGVELEPLVLDEDGFTQPPGEAAAAALVERIQRLSAGLARGRDGFESESAPQLLRYELESMAHYVRVGQWDRLAKLIVSLRPRHLPVLWHALRRMGKAA